MGRSRRRRKIACDPTYEQEAILPVVDHEWIMARDFVVYRFKVPYSEADDYLRAWRGTMDLHEFYAMLDVVYQFTDFEWIPF